MARHPGQQSIVMRTFCLNSEFSLLIMRFFCSVCRRRGSLRVSCRDARTAPAAIIMLAQQHEDASPTKRRRWDAPAVEDAPPTKRQAASFLEHTVTTTKLAAVTQHGWSPLVAWPVSRSSFFPATLEEVRRLRIDAFCARLHRCSRGSSLHRIRPTTSFRYGASLTEASGLPCVQFGAQQHLSSAVPRPAAVVEASAAFSIASTAQSSPAYDRRRVHVASIPYCLSLTDVQAAFSGFGAIQRIEMPQASCYPPRSRLFLRRTQARVLRRAMPSLAA